jgi:hypothetical protein
MGKNIQIEAEFLLTKTGANSIWTIDLSSPQIGLISVDYTSVI